MGDSNRTAELCSDMTRHIPTHSRQLLHKSIRPWHFVVSLSVVTKIWLGQYGILLNFVDIFIYRAN